MSKASKRRTGAGAGQTKSGYGKPPVAHQFKKGQSGNPRGRPPKAERSYTPRQVRRDILSVTEEPVTVRTTKGDETMPTVVACLKIARQKALNGHAPMLRFLIQRHDAAIAEHFNAHYEGYKSLESSEKERSSKVINDDKDDVRFLNFFRRRTRRI